MVDTPFDYSIVFDVVYTQTYSYTSYFIIFIECSYYV
jgi:hypothetical protein